MKGFESYHGRTNVTVIECITRDSLSKSNFVPYVVCGLRVKANSVWCVQCGSWIHSGCNGIKLWLQSFGKFCLLEM